MAKRKKPEQLQLSEHHKLEHAFHELEERVERMGHQLGHKLDHILRLLKRGVTTVFAETGVIEMQTTLKSLAGKDVLVFQTFDNSNPPQDITARCTYGVVTDAVAVTVDSSTGNTANVTYVEGSARLTISTTDAGGDSIPDVVLSCSIGPSQVPAAGNTLVGAQNPNTVIA